MASLELRNGVFRIVFRAGGKKLTRSLKTSDQKAARACLARLEDNLRRLELGHLTLPEQGDLATFLLSDGRLPNRPDLASSTTSVATLLDRYVASLPDGAIEKNTRYTIGIHVRHLKRILGKVEPVKRMGLSELQHYVDRRASEKSKRQTTISSVTIRKELATLSAAWRWGIHMGFAERPLPTRGLRYEDDGEAAVSDTCGNRTTHRPRWPDPT